MIINWDKIANAFADHERLIEREERLRAKGECAREEDLHLKRVIQEIPYKIEAALKLMRDGYAQEWVTIYAGKGPRAQEIIKGIESALHDLRVRTQRANSIDALQANLDDLKATALQQTRRPRIEMSGRPSGKK